MAIIPEDDLVMEEGVIKLFGFSGFSHMAPTLSNYLFFVMTVLIIYDYIITFTSEVMDIWQTSRKLSAPTLFFVLNRSTDVSACHNVVVFIRIGKISYYLGFVGIFILRTWAIYAKSMRILFVTGVFGAARLALAVYIDWALTSPRLVLDRVSRLGMCKTHYQPSYASWNVVLYCMQLSFDTIVFSLTIAQTVRAAREHKRRRLRNSLSVLLARDASLYFIPLETLMLFGLCASVIPSAPSNMRVVVNYFVTIFQNILANHLVLNLRAMSRKRACGACTFAQIITPVRSRGSTVHPDDHRGCCPIVPALGLSSEGRNDFRASKRVLPDNQIYLKSKIEEPIIEEPATFFFDPAFGRRSLILDVSHSSSKYGSESDSGESGIVFAPIRDSDEVETDSEVEVDTELWH